MISGGGKHSSRHLRDPSPKRLGRTLFCGVHLPTKKGKTVPRNAPGIGAAKQMPQIYRDSEN